MKKDSNGITTQVLALTPATAKAWVNVATNTNRTLRKSRVEQYAADMKAGRWQLNGEAIKFDNTGRLLNGQHRLHAIVLADVTVKMLVVSGLDPNTQTTMDTGLVAKNWDWSEIPYGREVASLCYALVLMRHPGFNRGLSRGEFEAVYQVLGPDLVQHVVKTMRPGIASRAPVRAGAVLLHIAEGPWVSAEKLPPKTAAYIERFTSLSAPMDSPENALFRAFGLGTKQRRGFKDHQQRSMVARAIVAALRGEETKLLRNCPPDMLTWLFEQAKINFPAGLFPEK